MACLSCCLSAEHRYLLLLYQRISILVAPLSIKEYRYLLLLHQRTSILVAALSRTSILVGSKRKSVPTRVVACCSSRCC